MAKCDPRPLTGFMEPPAGAVRGQVLSGWRSSRTALLSGGRRNRPLRSLCALRDIGQIDPRRMGPARVPGLADGTQGPGHPCGPTSGVESSPFWLSDHRGPRLFRGRGHNRRLSRSVQGDILAKSPICGPRMGPVGCWVGQLGPKVPRMLPWDFDAHARDQTRFAGFTGKS
jgi:hypothetical protein